jgi:hypothetical protein
VEGQPQKYNTVRGCTQTDKKDPRAPRGWAKNSDCPRSQVWIVYENGRAYPQYLVRYMRGGRDPARTPYASRAEAGVHNGPAGRQSRAVAAPQHRMVSSAGAANGGGGSGRSPHNDGASQHTPPPLGALREVAVHWKCVTDKGEVDYPPDITAMLEGAFNDSSSDPAAQYVEFKGATGYTYIVNVSAARMIQVSGNDLPSRFSLYEAPKSDPEPT